MRRRLLDVGLQTKRAGERQPAETGIRDVRIVVEVDEQEHVAARRDDGVGKVPQHTRGKTGHLEAEALSAWLKRRFCSKQ